MTEEKKNEMTPDERRLMKMEADLDETIAKVGAIDSRLTGIVRKMGQDRKFAEDQLTQVFTNQADLKGAIASLDGTVNKLLEQEKKRAEKQAEPVFCWLYSDNAEQMKAAEEQVEWFVDRILAHHPQGILNDCWRLHPMVVEHLLVLADLFTQSYSADLRRLPGQRADFWQRFLPTAIRMFKDELGECSLTELRHIDPTSYPVPRQAGDHMFRDFDDSWRDYHGKRQPTIPDMDVQEDSRRRAESGRAKADQRYDRDYS